MQTLHLLTPQLLNSFSVSVFFFSSDFPLFSPWFSHGPFPAIRQLTPSNNSFQPEKQTLLRASPMAYEASQLNLFQLLLMQCQGGATNTEERAVSTLLHAQAQRHSWLARVAVIDMGERTCHLSLPESIANFSLLGSWAWMAEASLGFKSPDDRVNSFLLCPTTKFLKRFHHKVLINFL